MAEPNRDSAGSQDIIDDALRLVDTLQRKLLVAGVRRGVSNATSPPPKKGDVWEEAVREDTGREEPPLDQLVGIARSAAPQVATHLGRAGMTLFEAFGDAWQVLDRSWKAAQERQRERQNGQETQGPGARSITEGD